MKNRIISTLAIFIVVLALFGFSYAHKQNNTIKAPHIIKQTYTLTGFHKDHITVMSNDNYNMFIDFYYDDQLIKENLTINDDITAYFVPYKDSYKIIGWNKSNIKIDSTTFKITKVDSSGFYCENDKQKDLFLSNEYLSKETKLHKGDIVNVYNPHNDNGMSEISKIVKVN